MSDTRKKDGRIYTSSLDWVGPLKETSRVIGLGAGRIGANLSVGGRLVRGRSRCKDVCVDASSGSSRGCG
jgi:hypothetical protein